MGEKKKWERITKPIASGKRKERSIFGKFLMTFFEEDIDSIWDHIKTQVLKPYAKEIAANIVTDSVNMALYGDTRRSRSRRTDASTYHAASNRRTSRAIRESNSRARRSSSSYILDDVIVVGDEKESGKEKAEGIIDTLCNRIEDYDEVPVGDLYDLVGARTTPVDYDYGWENVSGYSIRPLGDDEWQIIMPKPIALKN